jgi:acetyl-CoA C-acetyltransferase
MKTFICAAQRTPIGSFLGSLSHMSAPELGAKAIAATLNKLKIDSALVEDVYMGCVLSAGVGQAPARQAAIGAGIPKSTPCTTISKVCGSGLKAVMVADANIRAGEIHSAIAGGMESMSNSPFLIPRMRTGLRMGHGELVDSMIKDGLWDVYNNIHMGQATETLCKEKNITRAEQDNHAIESYTRAKNAIEQGFFKNEIVGIEIQSKKGTTLFENDEEPFKSDLAKIPSLKPVFDPKGSVTAANASSINDGAASLFLCSESFAKNHNLKPLAAIVGSSQAAQDPVWFTTAPARSIEKLMKKTGFKTSQVDLWEINEAFSAVAIANQRELEIDPSRINIQGGAVALGHPIGASGARILVTLLHSLQRTNKKYGVASLCIGGGEAVSLMVENLSA